ncbi:MAG: ABC transporter permease [Eubacteriales bacterium]|nr:ABC transporter permease [Eubacteriales bacterium]
MFWRMVRGTLFRQKSKMLMIAFTVALGISLCTAMMNVMLGVGDKINQELKTYGANINVVPKDASLLDDLYGISEGVGVSDKFLNEEDVPKIKQIFWGFNIVDFAPFLNVKAQSDDLGQEINVMGTWFKKEFVLPTGEDVVAGISSMKNWWTVEGEWLQDSDSEGIMLGSLIAGRNGLKLGDKLSLSSAGGEKTFLVRGIIQAGGPEDEEVFMNLASAQAISGLEGKVSSIEVSALTTPDNDLARKASQNPKSLTPSEYDVWYCTAYVSSICYQIQEVVSDAVAKPIRQVAESEGTILNKTQLLMLLITILSSIGSALGISNLVTASVIERRQEIGLIKAIGGRDIRIVLLILTEILLTGLFGGVLGYFAGLAFTQIIGLTVFGSRIPLAPMVIPIDLVLLLAVILIGSIPSIRYLLRLKPTEVLHGR